MFRIMSGLTTKKERDLAIQRELHSLQSRISRPNLSSNQIRELLTRGIYCETLGYSATCLYIHAIKLAQLGTLIDKRMGYLACTVFLHRDHELTLLLINTILKDLNSKNICEVNMALTAAAYLANKEMASVLMETVEKMMHLHPKVLIRKKAILFYKHLLLINPSYINTANTDHLKKCIQDRDPEVVSTVIHTLSDLVQMDAGVYSDLLDPCLAILKQIIRRKFPSDYDYHNLPAPWLQIEILKLLPFLNDVKRDQAPLVEVLEEVMKNIDTNHTMSNAIFYQCACAIVRICPHEHLLESAFKLISEFLLSAKLDMQYMGLKALTLLVEKGHPKYASSHKDFIIDSLHHEDTSIRSKTFNLLMSLVNSTSIQVVWPKLMKHIDMTVDKGVKDDLIVRCAHLLQIHSPKNEWKFEKVLLLVHKSSVEVHSLLLLILRNMLNTESAESSLIPISVDKCSEILKEHLQSNELVEFCVWVISTYAATNFPRIILQLAQLLSRYSEEHNVLSSILIAIKKLLLKNNELLDQEVERLIGDCVNSKDCLVRHWSRELNAVIKNIDNIKNFFDDSANGHYDWTLSFLDPIVEISLKTNPTSLPYKLRKKIEVVEQASNFNSLINTPTVVTKSSLTSSRGSSIKSSSIGINVDYLENVWSKDGYCMDKKSLNQNDEDDNIPKKPLEKHAEDAELAMALFNNNN